MNYWNKTEEVIINRIKELGGEPKIEFELNLMVLLLIVSLIVVRTSI